MKIEFLNLNRDLKKLVRNLPTTPNIKADSCKPLLHSSAIAYVVTIVDTPNNESPIFLQNFGVGLLYKSVNFFM